jgi:hypothetical protein
MAFPRVTRGANFKLMFGPVHLNKPRPIRTQCLESGLPGAEHRNLIPGLLKTGGKKRRKRARANDEDVIIHETKVTVTLLPLLTFGSALQR